MSGTGPRVLLIEDEAQMRRFLKASLTAHGYRLLETATAEEGLRQATAYNPEIVLLDLGLPDLDGLAVIKRLREWTTVPVIVISARDQEQEKIEALDNGADDYLTKPFGAGELLARIRVALRHADRADCVKGGRHRRRGSPAPGSRSDPAEPCLGEALAGQLGLAQSQG